MPRARVAHFVSFRCPGAGLLLAAAFLLLASVNARAIVGARPMAPGHPALLSAVALETDASDGSSSGICTGVLVAPDLVLTAAHCLWKQKVTAVVFGPSVDRRRGPQLRRALAARGHPRYQDALAPEFDIGWVRFEGALPRGFVPVPVLTNATLLRKGFAIEMAGYGDTGSTRDDSGTLRATVSVLDHIVPDMNIAFRNMAFVGPTPGRGTCHGDSGGPAYVNAGGWKLLGVSRGSMESCEAGASIFTFAAPYLEWIQFSAGRRF